MTNNKKNELQNPPLVINSDIEQIYLTGAFGGPTPHDFRIIVFNEASKNLAEDGHSVDLIRDATHELIMSHLTAKELYDWLGRQLKQLEIATKKSNSKK